MQILGRTGNVTTEEHGGKAVGIWLLASLGLPVPQTIALALGEAASITTEQTSELLTVLGICFGGEGGLALRSSAVDEDTDITSGAGRFESRLLSMSSLNRLEDLSAAIREVGYQQGGNIGVVVQPLIDAAYGGAAFGLDVRDHSRARYTFSWVKGSPSAMLAGEEPGFETWLEVDKDTFDSVPKNIVAAARYIRDSLTAIQEHTAYPVDVEWVLPAGEPSVQFVQCRRVVLPAPATIDLNDAIALQSIPASIRAHPKIRVREAAVSVGARCSSGLLYVEALKARDAANLPILTVGKGSAISVVLLYPRTVLGQVLRTFVGRSGSDVESMVRECHRYAIRTYPAAVDAEATVHDTIRAGLESSWLTGTVAMEVLPFRLTGMASMSSQDITIELAEGHFVPKGIVETSVFVVRADGSVLRLEAVDQQTAFRIIDGYVVEEHPVEAVKLTEYLIRQIATELRPLLQLPTIGGVEFGVLQQDSEFTVVVIDASDDDQVELPPIDLMMNGVLSPGRATGTALNLRIGDAKESMEAHFFDHGAMSGTMSTVFVADRPALELLDVAKAADTTCGFIFREASVLSHLIVVLRERGIPAIAVGDSISLISDGAVIALDALDPLLSREKRWTPHADSAPVIGS